jgi:riboflavin synthase
MFTGIIESVGIVNSIEKGTVSGKIGVQVPPGFLDNHSVKIGDSIAVDGACLTVTSFFGDGFTADISAETFSLTTLGALSVGARVNLESALTLDTPIGGHLVSGHIDGVGKILKRTPSGASVDMEIALSKDLMAQVIKKGSIAVDGISLTIAEITREGVRIALIPKTLEGTTLIEKKDGAKLNIETDIIGKYVENYIKGKDKTGTVTESFLKEHGFIKKG